MWPGRRAAAAALAFAAGYAVMPAVGSAYASAGASRAASPSYYEGNASPAVLYRQGRAAGLARVSGLVILDFGRPAYDAGRYGTLDFTDHFAALDDITASAEAYAAGYLSSAPRYRQLTVAIGTNNSCGTGQPCGRTRSCGCVLEPPSYLVWGRQLAYAVTRADAGVVRLRASRGYTDDVRVVAGDDAEPAFDPAYRNTHDLLAGYAAAVGGSRPAMVDFGDATPGSWSQEQLFQVAYGFRPDVPVPEVYLPSQARHWAALVRYALRRHRVSMTILGVLTQDPAGNTPGVAYAEMVAALTPLTGQTSIRWLSEIGRRPPA